MADRKLLKRWWALVDSNHRLNIVSTSCRSADDILDVKKRWYSDKWSAGQWADVKVTPHKNDVGDYEKEKGQDKSTCCLVPGRLAGQESRVYRNHAADESLSLSGVSRTALLGRLQINSEKALPVLIE